MMTKRITVYNKIHVFGRSIMFIAVMYPDLPLSRLTGNEASSLHKPCHLKMCSIKLLQKDTILTSVFSNYNNF